MNKKLLAIAIATSAFTSQAVAIELYNANGSTFAIGGHVSVALSDSDKGELEVISASPRLNFNATHDMGNGFVADAKGEWALNYLTNGENAFTTRLGYIGLTHENAGRVVVGTQWAPYYNAVATVDKPISYASDFTYSDHANLGTGRADKMVSYTNTLALGESQSLTVAGGWQGAHGDYETRLQAAISYNISDFAVNYAFTTGDVATDNAQSHIVSASYGSWGNGLYVAGAYAMGEYMITNSDKEVLPETNVIEFLAGYGLSNGVNLIANYESVTDEKKDSSVYETAAVQAEYKFTQTFVGFAGYQFGLDGSEDNNNQWKLGVRYYL
ncbi:porin [Enterovibrio sp. ZSDZ35]|uniref:Porin n=1 Tax=Enterovibrio qingdaonensis TaxID=2899818 RepID=A0ABT5QKP6_9GAMM|nr:porin [Enterovibrio sp. ZSDZ35]MDD1781557.1 porin [Enterovibrio sp. ZSDZ35]